jgi:glycosyltransferase involved in cell wall biosynthesis
VKRPELAIRALAHVPPPARLVIVGEGSHRSRAEQAAADAGVSDRVVFIGAATGDELVKLYADALAVIYAPFDEDYGYVTLEAFLAEKPVMTATDSGGTLEFVVDGENGYVCPPDPEALGRAAARLAADKQLAARLGRAGSVRARTITWDGVVEQLLG